jgi:hypothetical protein
VASRLFLPSPMRISRGSFVRSLSKLSFGTFQLGSMFDLSLEGVSQKL